MRRFLKNVSALMSVNLLSFGISALITLIVPKFLSVSEYSYFQLYLFYLNYIGFCCIGWIDGIVLRYAGKYYEDLNKSVFSGQFRIYTLLESIIGTIVIISAIFFDIKDENEVKIYIFIGVAIIIVQVNSFFRYLLQAVNYIDIYAQNIFIEKSIYIIGVLIALVCKKYSFQYLIYSDLFGKVLALIHMLGFNKDILKAPSSNWRMTIDEAKVNINSGIKLLVANGSSLLIVGVIRYAIQKNWSVETFGKVSLSLSVSNMFMVFVQAIGISLFPMLRRIKQEILSKLYLIIRHVLMFPMLGILILYYPAYVILSHWLPQYAESLHYMALMFPICIFESKIQLLIEPYLKSLRREKELLKINVSAVFFSVIASVISIGLYNNLNLSILSIVVVLGYRCTVLELIVEKEIDVKLKKDIIQELFMVSGFIIFNWCIGGVVGVIAYFICYVIYIMLNRNSLIETFLFIKRGVQKEV